MFLSALVYASEHRAVVPCSLLSLSQVPFASAALVTGGLSWVLPRRVSERIDNSLYRCYMRLCLFVFENVSGVDLVVSGDVDELLQKRENAVILSNHQSNADWAVISMLAARHSPEGSIESIRFMVKHSIQYVPLFGWYIYQHGYIFVRRGFGFSAASAAVGKQLSWMDSLAPPPDYPPFWLLIFPEGTRKSEKTLETSAVFSCLIANAQEEVQPCPLSQVLSPRAGGFQFALERLSHLQAVYDVTIAYSQTSTSGSAPGMFSFVCCPPSSTVHVHVKRIGKQALPEAEGGACREWMEERFMEKEKLLENYRQTGHLDAATERVSPFDPDRNYRPAHCSLPLCHRCRFPLSQRSPRICSHHCNGSPPHSRAQAQHVCLIYKRIRVIR